MAGALDGLSVKAEVYSHEDVTGVGYGICAFHPGEADAARRFLDLRKEKEEKRLAERRAGCDLWVRLAWESVESYVLTRKVLPVPPGLPDAITHTRAGAFVSIHKQGQLRGCIGTIAPTKDSLAEEIIANAVSASSRDPRFDPICPDELPSLEISVDVLGEPESIRSAAELDVKRYGVIVTKGTRRGLLLPDLDGVDTVEEQIAIALGLELEGGARSTGAPDPNRFARLTEKVAEIYPNIRVFATTLRETVSADRNRLSAALRTRESFCVSRTYEITGIVDRIGAGDAFDAGLIYGLTHFDAPSEALEFAAAAAVLKHSVPGDLNLATLDEVAALAFGGADGRIKR